MSKGFLAIIIASILAVGGLIVANRNGSESNNASSEPSTHVVGAVSEAGEVEPTEPQPKEDAVVLVEYGDFQCSACAQYYPIVEQLKEKYQDQLAFQFRHFPLVAIHSNAMAAHKAAEAAANQGKFWGMYDLLYQRQQSWESSNNPGEVFAGYAQELGLNMDQYNADVASEEVNATIQADLQAGQDLNITGTPTFFIDGERIDNPTSLEAFEQLIEDAIKEKTTG